MRVGSLFAGIGGFDLGLERAGFDIAWQVEIDLYCQRVLAKHWPHVTRYGDIRTIDWATVPRVDLLCGGFPCQDISVAGKGAGLSGTRSGLWSEYVRAIEALQPAWILIENVAALRARGLDQVLGALAALGYDAEWHCLPASAFGAPHRRDRVWIIAYDAKNVSDSNQFHDDDGRYGASPVCGERSESAELSGSEGNAAYPNGEPTGRIAEPWRERREWEPEPPVGRVAHGIPSRVDRLRGLGNAIVPQIAEWIGRQIIKGGH